MKVKKLHNWNLSYSQAIALQKGLSGKVQIIELKKPPKIVAGIDCAFSGDKKKIFACAVLLKLPDFEIIETASAVQKLAFPYIPGLLSFREAPACIAAVGKLKNEPDAFIIDGQGIAHPRRFGLACHLGLFFDKPTIGCAKSRLTGSFEEPAMEKCAYSPLKDGRETIGAIVRTRSNVKPVFVSVGNKCLLKDAIKIALACTTRYRIPEPSRLAHQLVSKLKLKI
ncbi:MAG: endonuclease V [Sedimentisphaerales bacterium]|nr:endonuclease V [Sedimentisphaerales bacterium]